jgi:hypothetical protein
MGEILCFGVCCRILGGPPCYPIGSLVELLTPILQAFLKAYSRIAEKHKQSRICWLLTEIYLSLDEVILEQYWRVLYSGFKVVSNNYYFSSMFLHEPLGKWLLQ